MKNKIFKLWALSLVALLTIGLVAFTACSVEPPPALPPDGASIAIMVDTQRFEWVTTQTYIGLVLDELVEEEGLVFTYGYATGLGRFISTLGDLPSGSSTFIMLYLTSNDLRWAIPTQTRVVDGTTFYSANLGIDSLPVLDGETYLFVAVTF